MKKIIGLALAIGLAVILAGCSNDESIIQPIVGTWETEAILGTSTTAVINKDDTCVETYTLLGVIATTKNGTWSKSGNVLTRVWSSSDTATDTYSLSDGNKQLTLDSGVTSQTYTRK